MKQLVTDAIVLSRVNYGEADRIVKVLTPDVGKLSLLARGVRKPKSKLAGGIELFSVSSITYIQGRGELATLVSSRLDRHYGDIVKHIERVQLGYELIKQLDRATEDEPEAEYFHLLQEVLSALDDSSLDVRMVRFWFEARLVQMSGHSPNLHTDTAGNKLVAGESYVFDFDAVSFNPQPGGAFATDHIKFLRLAFDGHSPKTLQQISDSDSLLQGVMPLVQTMLTSYIRV